MARVKRGVTTRAKHKRILDSAKGYYGRRKNTIRIARQAVEKAGQYAYRDRKVKKRSFRALWIQRINAAVRAEGLTYGQFIHALNLAGVTPRPQGPRRHRDARGRGVQRDHRPGEGRAGEEGGLSLPQPRTTKGVGSDSGALFVFRCRERVAFASVNLCCQLVTWQNPCSCFLLRASHKTIHVAASARNTLS